jgi:hypothetical protein
MRRNLLLGAGGFMLGAALFGAVATFAAAPSTTPLMGSPAFQQMYSASASYMAQYYTPSTGAPSSHDRTA